MFRPGAGRPRRGKETWRWTAVHGAMTPKNQHDTMFHDTVMKEGSIACENMELRHLPPPQVPSQVSQLPEHDTSRLQR